MGDVLTPLSIWLQISNFFFLICGLHGDLLIIRLSLCLAYGMIVVNSVVGSPLWPNLTGPGGGMSLDSLVWALVSMYVHGASLLALIWDEQEVQLTDDQEALWRMMYRTGGLSKRLFQSIIANKLSIVELNDKIGQNINTDDFFYIVYEGQVKLHVIEHNISVSNRILVSGEMFDLNMIGFFSENSVFHSGRIRCHALTHTVRLFRIAKDDMQRIAHHPLAKGVWQALLINNLSYVVESSLSAEHRSNAAVSYQDKIFRQLESWELPKNSVSGSGHALQNPVLHCFKYIRQSFSPPWPFQGHPIGIRQTQLPPPPQRPTESQEPPRFHRFLSFRRSNQSPPTNKQQFQRQALELPFRNSTNANATVEQAQEPEDSLSHRGAPSSSHSATEFGSLYREEGVNEDVDTLRMA